MPEGPTVVILKEEVQPFAGKTVIEAAGNSKIPLGTIQGQTIRQFKSWGKHFLICFNGFALRVHFLMWGSYRINVERQLAPRLKLVFENGFVCFYSCAIRFIDRDPETIYDFSSDVMSDTWDTEKARAKVTTHHESLVCDVLLDQEIFSGVGNIIKNEVLYRIKVHPESQTGKIPSNKIDELVKEARNYSFDFYEWKKKFELKKHWLAHNRKVCVRCNLPLVRRHTGLKNRRSFFCGNCQVLY
ncbi:MAG TPA: DNA-formamidopyrimidine glycosylase family protein [Bacteroidales bacterium]|nr:DNA-formamidopyrimidine glycosylase family protein [Bacteroidales bacterium]